MAKNLHIIGPDSGWLPGEDVEFLGKLMGQILYHEIDKASEMLLQLTSVDLENLERSGHKLSILASVIRGD